MSQDGKKILILQGPLGPFFADLARELSALGFETHRICFNKGDRHYALADHITDYEARPDSWAAWFETYMSKHSIDGVCCYGDSRFYHQEARAVCKRLRRPVFCFEEGYVRPGFVTMEEGGNNANSEFPAQFKVGSLPERPVPAPAHIANAFRFQFWFAVLYYTVKDWRIAGYHNNKHHRRGNWATELMAWIKGGLRKNLLTRLREHGLTQRLMQHQGPLFFVPLQVAVDAQMIHHSPFGSVPDFIEATIRSFAAHAPADAHIVIKHHPMDRGFHHYGKVIRKLCRTLRCGGRVTYAFDLDLDVLLLACAGCVTVNSTVGLQAIDKGVPTIMLGESMARDAGLTSGQSLDEFWAEQMPVDLELAFTYRQALIAHTQQPGSFYRDRGVAVKACAAAIMGAVKV